MDTEKLRSLHKLKEEGVLSEDEFQAEKHKLLNEPSTRATSQALTTDEDRRQYAMFIHLSLLLGLAFPWIGLIIPIVLWLVRREDEYIDKHGRVVANWLISSIIYSIVGFILLVVIIGFGVLLALAVCHIIFAIVGAIKAKDGELWHYPLSIKFFRV
ncbi:hypothetical protein A28LD_1120 [Idiomarina sp. A28L]|uniref:DUF4870 domain-containing protein n=1 Tax=Idiomarina sp. A28L TaxID=1036674 RepID=UPI0002138DBB|nr:DUF4870 domain-containing protein [Idiomarina sp. A28L]EGN75507.1 hypothetical protein A28LD_1120 [Idiomarina sp. A28L]